MYTEDYEWILRQLLMANDNLAPHTIIVDDDHAKEAACANVIGHTVLLNCIWHLGHQNLNKNLRGALGKDWQAFISAFGQHEMLSQLSISSIGGRSTFQSLALANQALRLTWRGSLSVASTGPGRGLVQDSPLECRQHKGWRV